MCWGVQTCKLVLSNSDENLQLTYFCGTFFIFIHNLRKSPGHHEILDASKLQPGKQVYPCKCNFRLVRNAFCTCNCPGIAQFQKVSVVLLSAVSHMESTEDALLLFAADSPLPVAQWPEFMMGRGESETRDDHAERQLLVDWNIPYLTALTHLHECTHRVC